MSHELRTPMNAIMGMTELVLRNVHEERQKEQLGKVMQASRHLLGVINDILDISRIEANRLPLEEIDLQVGDVLDNLNHMVSHKIHEKCLSLTINLSDQMRHLHLRGDPMRLNQVLLNLTSNAIKFTPDGSIGIQVTLAEQDKSSVLLRFEVSDSGLGISPEDQHRIFSAFEQADASTTRKFGGTGLGLAISKKLVELMGGEIGVHSELGVGSNFWFTARLKISQSQAAHPAQHVSRAAEAIILKNHAGRRVLLAEDEPINCEVATCILEEAGLKVDVAENGEIAVNLASQNRYDIILMDMQMPIMNGLEATQAIRLQSLNRQTPILAMTANAFEQDRQSCLDAGMNDHLGKPVDPDLLLETLLSWLEKQT
jgi:CheY-like chemotaxis protein/two-component sensor histidine kinase